MINTALSSPCSGPNSRFVSIHNGARPRHRSVHAAFVNTKWNQTWLERALLLDPIIFDMWSPGVRSWAPGQLCNSHHARHTGQDTRVVPCLRCGSFLCHKSVGGRGCGQQPVAFFHGFLARSAAVTRRSLCWSQRSSLILVVSHAIACVFSAESRHCLCFPQSLAIACVFPQSLAIACVSAETRHCFVFLLGFRCQQIYDDLAVFLIPSVCGAAIVCHAEHAALVVGAGAQRCA